MNKRGQLELIGLIVIVIIVVLAMLLFTVHKINNPSKDLKKGFVNKEVASGILIAGMKANVKECPHHSLDQLLVDCALSIGSRIYCGGEHSCLVANRTLYGIVNNSLKPIGRDFFLNLTGTIVHSEDGCFGKEKIQASQALPLSLGLGSARLVLDVCS